MKAKLILLFLFVFGWNMHAQVDIQKRFQSDTRKYYIWNKEFEKYELRETEYENSEIGRAHV